MPGMTENWKVIQAELARPFPAEEVEWRVQQLVSTSRGERALVLAYLTSRAVMNRLDSVVGPHCWRDSYERWGDTGVKCTLALRSGSEWVGKEDGADETDIESTKGGFSAALKRAAVKWGIGRYLYGLGNTWAAVHTERGTNRLYAGKGKYFDPPTLPAWALPSADAADTGQRGPAQADTPPQQEKPDTGSAGPGGGQSGNGVEHPVCSRCGEPVKSEKVVKFSRERLGAVVCYGCQQGDKGTDNGDNGSSNGGHTPEPPPQETEHDGGKAEGVKALLGAVVAAATEKGTDRTGAERIAGYLKAGKVEAYDGPKLLKNCNVEQLEYLANLLQKMPRHKVADLVERLERVDLVFGEGEDDIPPF